MPQIEELRRERAGINQRVQVLAAVETGGGTLTAEQLTEFASLQQQFTDISAKIERLEAAERAAALVAKPVKATQQAPGISIKAEPKQYTGAGMTRLVMSIAAAQGNVQGAAKFAAEELNDQSVSMAINTAAASGGVLIPQNLHSEVIELLRDRTIGAGRQAGRFCRGGFIAGYHYQHHAAVQPVVVGFAGYHRCHQCADETVRSGGAGNGPHNGIQRITGR